MAQRGGNEKRAEALGPLVLEGKAPARFIGRELNRAQWLVLAHSVMQRLLRYYVACLWAFLSVFYVESDSLTFSQIFET